jgi:adenosylcobyric acid synthase
MVGKPVFVVPFLYNLNLPEEDGLGIERRLAGESSEGQRAKSTSESDAEEKPVVVVIAYPHTAMSDDLCPLEADPRFKVEWRRRSIPRPYPHTSAVILPGSRLTRLDLKWLHDSGWGDFIRKHVAAGGSVLGICGGYQMLGWSVEDPSEAEGAIGSKQGLGLLPISTTIKPAECKVIAPRKGALYPSKIQVEGFELHCGQSRILAQVSGGHQIKPFLFFEDGLPEGMSSDRVKGTYLHGVLRSPEARVELLVPHIDKFPLLEKLEAQDPLDRFAKHLESCGLNFDTVKGMIDKHSNS